MNVGALLDDIRELYVSKLVAAVQDARRDPTAAVIGEPETVNREGDLVTEGVLDVGMRSDFAIVSDSGAETMRVDSDRTISFAPFEFAWGPMAVRLRPFNWDYCEVNVAPPLATDSYQVIGNWFRRWFEPADPDAELLGVAHFVSDPEQNGAHQRYYIDFGTAPVEAFEQFLDACVLGGATEVTIGVDRELAGRCPTSR